VQDGLEVLGFNIVTHLDLSSISLQGSHNSYRALGPEFSKGGQTSLKFQPQLHICLAGCAARMASRYGLWYVVNLDLNRTIF
jgi:hypothetical protein